MQSEDGLFAALEQLQAIRESKRGKTRQGENGVAYSADNAAKLEEQAHACVRMLLEVRMRLLMETEPSLRIEKAKEYLKFGVARRISTIERCIENVFTLFPTNTTRPLASETIEDVKINIQAHTMNVTGVLDNWAHVFCAETGANVKPESVGLFKEATKKLLPERLAAYLRDSKISEWHKQYAKDYRDSLAHRIPLYVPPAQMTAEEQQAFNDADRKLWDAIKRHDFNEVERFEREKDSIGTPAFFAIHAFGEAAPIKFHPQMLADAMTLSELSKHCMAEIPLAPQ
ncbi:hypothetical protein DWU98_15750 [Dyella monticola]|uniref:Uncharacterized protein n=1 Tax=Dyella monticola TaxID=1927958 RepID=A0A370WV93_9GAMM|nr:hypothetical protein [Dyella monticola]RDS79895.1 hypothetical protein DWU98_15750 [Dyella monticola]